MHTALFTGRRLPHGVTEYISRRTGKRYQLLTDAEDCNGFMTICGGRSNTFTSSASRSDALRIIELVDGEG